MDFKLELVVLPVADVDRAKAFYLDKAGFRLDVDHATPDFRVVQFTPPGSACSVTLMKMDDPPPGSVRGLHLVVTDIHAARDELVGRGVDASEIFHFGAQGRQPGPDPARARFNSFVAFSDPDGNGWLVQEVIDGNPSPRPA